MTQTLDYLNAVADKYFSVNQLTGALQWSAQ